MLPEQSSGVLNPTRNKNYNYVNSFGSKFKEKPILHTNYI